MARNTTPEGFLLSNLPAGDLARCKTIESDDTWPTMVEVVVYWGEGRTKRRSIEISANEFFGRGGHGAPITGDALINRIDRLRRSP